MYLNSSRLTLDSTSGVPNNLSLVNANGQRTRVGADASGTPVEYDGYMAEINMIDGQALTPASFGETNDDGVWVPKAYSGSYGNNGFFIDGRDSSDLGDDESGNGNDFTSTGLTAADQVTDTPTLNHCTLNPLITPATMTFADGNLALSGYTASTSAYGTFGLSSGKWFWQIVAQANAMAGISATPNGSQYPGQAADSYAMDLTNGTKYNNGSSASYGSGEITAGDVIGVGFDADAGTLKFYDSDGNDIGTAYSSLTSGPYFPVFRNGNSANISINFGQTGAFTFTPTGYKALNTSNLSTPTITDPSKYFQADLYTAQTTGFSPTFDGNSDLAPDFLWFKRRDGASNNFLFDKVRGVNLGILSDATTAEATYTHSLTAFGTDGFTLGDGGSRNDINGVDADTYVAWGWAAGVTSGSTNDDGSVDSTVTANTTAGFSIVKWVHTTSANYTVGHGLGATPKMVIVKTLDQGTNWGVYHSDITVGNRLILNTTAAQGTGYWGANTWNSTVFSIGSIRDANSSNAIGYVFAEVEGFSKFGSYTGNGNADGPFVYTGFKPAFLMYKVTSTTDSWEMYDTQRQTFNVYGTQLKANLSNAETDDTRVDLLSNGFKARSSNTAINTSGGTYIYMAFAEHPFGGEDIAPATAS